MGTTKPTESEVKACARVLRFLGVKSLVFKTGEIVTTRRLRELVEVVEADNEFASRA